MNAPGPTVNEAEPGVNAEAKRNRLVRPPQGDFTRGHLLWLPDDLPAVHELVVTVPHRPPTLNDLNQLLKRDARTRGHKGYSSFKEAWEAVIRHYWVLQAHTRGSKPPRIVGPYRCSYLYLCGQRNIDPSNLHAAFEKLFLDALVDGNCLGGDDFGHHIGSTYQPQHTPGQWGVVVTITADTTVTREQIMDRRKNIGRYRTRRRPSRPPRSTTG